MDQIICDICGSEYPGTADICPVCSYPRQGDEKAAEVAPETVRTKVKGGQFSAKNVRKRRKAQLRAAHDQERGTGNRGLWITIILLLIAIVLVSAYIAQRFLGGWGSFTGGSQTTPRPGTTAAQPVETALACDSLILDATVLELEGVGMQATLGVQALPENTTDKIAYATADPAVAQVSAEGVVTAVGAGQTTVTVTCGAQKQECTVICRIPLETTVPVPTTVPPQTTEPPVLMLDHEDVSFFQPGEAFTIKVLLGENYISRSDVTWSSTDPDVASVEKGYVAAVGPGTATITAKYQGQKAVCIVRCQFQDTNWRASSTDVSMAVGESFRLSVVNGSGKTADAVWSMDKEGIVSMENGTVTALASGVVTLSAEVDDVPVRCIVRVK